MVTYELTNQRATFGTLTGSVGHSYEQFIALAEHNCFFPPSLPPSL